MNAPSIHNYFSIGFALSGVITLACAVVVLWLAPGRKETRLWAVLCALVFLWSLGRWIMMGSETVDAAFRVQQWMYIPTILISPVFLHFVEALLKHPGLSRVLIAAYAWAITLIVLNWTTRLFIPEMGWIDGYGYFERAGPLFHFHTLVYILLPLRAAWLMNRERECVQANRRRQMEYLMAATAVGYISGLANFPYAIEAGFLPYPAIFVGLYVVVIAFAIIRHQLMDIRVVVRKTAVYSILSAGLLGLYVTVVMTATRLSEGYFKSPSLFISVLATGMTAVLFNPFRIWIQRWVDRRFPRESLDQNLLREVTGGFVHEIKKPLSTLTMPAQLARMEIQRARDGEISATDALDRIDGRLDYIIHQSRETADMIEAIWDLASIHTTVYEPVDLNELLAHVIQDGRSRLDQHRIQVLRQLPAKPLLLQGHRKQLAIAFGNLVKNAIESMADLPEGRPRQLEIRLENEKGNVKLQISDSGKGIAPDALPRLFEPWVTTKGSQGMGIGLYLTREILRRHHASIEVESQADLHTTFTICFLADTESAS